MSLRTKKVALKKLFKATPSQSLQIEKNPRMMLPKSRKLPIKRLKIKLKPTRKLMI
jgi:hypothetical protein